LQPAPPSAHPASLTPTPTQPATLASLDHGLSVSDSIEERHTLSLGKLYKRSFAPSGRFSRSEFAVVLFASLAAWMYATFVHALGMVGVVNDDLIRLLTVITSLAAIFATGCALAGAVRRLHDLAKTGWYVLVVCVPYVNVLFVLYLLFAPGYRSKLPGAKRSTGVAAAIGISLLVGVPFLGILSALRARVARNESLAIADVRTFISAQTAYQSANGGWFAGDLACLSEPSRSGCIPDYPPDAPRFLDPGLTSLNMRFGYSRLFTPGATPRPLDQRRAGPSSVTSYVYWAVPAKPGQSGVRGFAGDSSGNLCFSPTGEPPAVLENVVVLDSDSPSCIPFR
jgi:uncharacterized membrane protein YhaH (DUF805 family)